MAVTALFSDYLHGALNTVEPYVVLSDSE